MIHENEYFIPEWPDKLQEIDVAKVRFVLEFQTPCCVHPSDFLGIGRVLRMADRQIHEPRNLDAAAEWATLFQPSLSDDPVARRKFQKPAPAFVLNMPILESQTFDVGDHLCLEVLFIGTGIPLIHVFLRSLTHLGNLGLVAGEGQFDVTEVYNLESDHADRLVWRQGDVLEKLACSVQSVTWWLEQERVGQQVTINFTTPVRLMVEGKPMRKPTMAQIVPFMLRRVTSMLYAHCRLEVIDDPGHILKQVNMLETIESRYSWHDWRPLPGRRGMSVGGFKGHCLLQGQAMEGVYWVFAVASLLGIGKGASYGAGRFEVVG